MSAWARKTVAELRSELDARAISYDAKAKKAALVELLQNVDGQQSEAAAPGKKRKREPASQVEVAASSSGTGDEVRQETKVLKKGRAVLDKFISEDVKAAYHVFEREGAVFDAMLNQTNVGSNNNKFYIIQLLEKDGGGGFYVWTRWGRVGTDGQWDLHGRDKLPFRSKPKDGMLSIAPYLDLASAMDTFQSKFFDKTRNRWEERASFQKVPGKYHLLEMDYERNHELVERRNKMAEQAKAETPASKLEPAVQHLISLICNVDMMHREMVEIGYDAKKMPLGSLSAKTIKEGLAILQRIGSVLEKTSRENLVELTSQYYTLIPHDFGRRSIKDQVIRTAPHLKRELELLDSLSNIEIAFQILDQPVEKKVNPIDAHYERMRCQVAPVTDASELDMIRTYVANTRGRTHEFSLAVDQVYRVHRDGEDERFAPSRALGNRALLWHGSRLSNWVGILSSGLRVAPPEAPVTGYMFGKGIYFADMVTKSGQYCFTTPKQNKGLLLLSEVALGSVNEKLQHDYKGNKLPPGKHSVKGVGRAFPDPSHDLLLPDGLRVPLGPAKEIDHHGGELQYNEYIVYSEAQVRMHYLVECSFTHNFC